MFLRSIGRPLLAKVKQTTGIVGLDVVPNVRADEGYRKAVESFTRHRLNVCKEEEDWEAIEKRLGCGQVEELIEEAQDELTLIGKMIAHRSGPLPEEFYKTLKGLLSEAKTAIPAASSSDPKLKE
ncbi:hypothetical protein EUTSA_v10015894mg [Eutrema salsugineum]|uniref:Uncharacterized protein n=1 Tax=Eutrema salsugineum TaxID=72664 RepID=V4LKR8_EUTSA|nr:hypothetical protein EUTSA_v10015894mg [Eutrema salsugineum]